MAKLNVDQKTILELFSDRRADFLIPDYQRPYSWEEDECGTLWKDVFDFAFPDRDYTKFDNEKDEYFLGPIVTFRNADGKMEVIDGQQRLTTLMLLLRAFYKRFGSMNDPKSISTRESLGRCIWKTDEFGNPDMDRLKIDSRVVSDEERGEFLEILRNGHLRPEMRSRYAKNYGFFENAIDDFLNEFPGYFPYLPIRIMSNCIVLPIEADSQDTALRIFSTLNDRGLPLSDSDIFKSQLYNYYNKKGEVGKFIERWKNLEELCGKVFNPRNGSPMDELFTRYMYFLRAKDGISRSTTEALRKFFEKEDYELLRNDHALSDLESLVGFWYDVSIQSQERFSDRVLRRLFVLNYAPNGMWTYLVSVYFLQNRDTYGNLGDEGFYNFLVKITAFIWAYAIENPGVNALRTPVYPEMVNIVNGRSVSFEGFKFDPRVLKSEIDNIEFTNNRPLTKSMLAWWAFNDDDQSLLSLETSFDIEHIVSRKLQESEHVLSDDRNLESLGNKSLLEKRINIPARDYYFRLKKRYYLGFENARGQRRGSDITELRNLSVLNDFREENVVERYNYIVESFIDFLGSNDLLR